MELGHCRGTIGNERITVGSILKWKVKILIS